MSHFAKVEKGTVTEVIVAEKDFINSGAVGDEFLWVQTSYNGNFRGRFASVGGVYDKLNDVFISKQPYSSWVLSESNTWEAPTIPNNTKDSWNEDTLSWDEVTE